MKKALIVVDYQNDFVDGALGFLGAENIAEKVYNLVAKAMANKDFIVFTKVSLRRCQNYFLGMSLESRNFSGQ